MLTGQLNQFILQPLTIQKIWSFHHGIYNRTRTSATGGHLSNREMYILVKDVLLNSLDLKQEPYSNSERDTVIYPEWWYWCPTEYSSNGAWYYNGTYGTLYTYRKYITDTCSSPLLIITLNLQLWTK